MDNIELHKLIEEAEEEFRVFERMGADTGRKVLDLVNEAVKNNGVLQIVSDSDRRSCYNIGKNCPSGGKLPKAGECSFCKYYR